MGKKIAVYLAGPIEGVTLEEAIEWRAFAGQFLGEIGIEIFNPMAGKENIVGPGELILFDRYRNPGHPLHYLTKSDSVFYRDIMNIRKSDFILVNFNVKTCSIGTPWEMGFAYGIGKTVIVVTQDPSVMNHPFVNMSSVIFTNMEDALSFIASNVI